MSDRWINLYFDDGDTAAPDKAFTKLYLPGQFIQRAPCATPGCNGFILGVGDLPSDDTPPGFTLVSRAPCDLCGREYTLSHREASDRMIITWTERPND